MLFYNKCLPPIEFNPNLVKWYRAQDFIIAKKQVIYHLHYDRLPHPVRAMHNRNPLILIQRNLVVEHTEQAFHGDFGNPHFLALSVSV